MLKPSNGRICVHECQSDYCNVGLPADLEGILVLNSTVTKSNVQMEMDHHQQFHQQQDQLLVQLLDQLLDQVMTHQLLVQLIHPTLILIRIQIVMLVVLFQFLHQFLLFFQHFSFKINIIVEYRICKVINSYDMNETFIWFLIFV